MRENLFKNEFFKNFAEKVKNRIKSQNKPNFHKKLDEIFSKDFEKKISLIENKIIPNKDLKKKLTFYRAKTKFAQLSLNTSQKDFKFSKFKPAVNHQQSENNSLIKNNLVKNNSFYQIGEENKEYEESEENYFTPNQNKYSSTPSHNTSQMTSSQVIKLVNTFKSFPNNTLISAQVSSKKKNRYNFSESSVKQHFKKKQYSFGSSKKILPRVSGDESFFN